jgi:hypothetical protein
MSKLNSRRGVLFMLLYLVGVGEDVVVGRGTRRR